VPTGTLNKLDVNNTDKLDVNNTDNCGQCETELMGQKRAPVCERSCKKCFHVKYVGISAGELDVLVRKKCNVV